MTRAGIPKTITVLQINTILLQHYSLILTALKEHANRVNNVLYKPHIVNGILSKVKTICNKDRSPLENRKFSQHPTVKLTVVENLLQQPQGIQWNTV
jgi:hypothetical protein